MTYRILAMGVLAAAVTTLGCIDTEEVLAEPEANLGGELAEGEEVSFSQHIVPIFEAYCTSCHSGSSAAAALDLTSYDDTLSVVVPGDVGSSTLYKVIDNGMMPPEGSGPTDAEVGTIAQWIDQGALDN